MSVRAVAWALYDASPGQLDATERMILVVLADHAGTELIAWPSRQQLAHAAGCSTDTIDRRIKQLLARRLIRLADPDECPAAWRQAERPDLRPRAYRLLVPSTGPQVAAPLSRTGPQHAGERGRNTPGNGAATVRHTSRTTSRTTDARAREAADRPTPTPDRFDAQQVWQRRAQTADLDVHALAERARQAIAR